MRIAYLFAKKASEYDIDFQVLSAMTPDELQSLDTLVRTGVWGLLMNLEGRDGEIEHRAVKLFYGGDGNISWTDNARLASAVKSGPIYTVQFLSLSRSLALALHRRLSKHDNYLGYVQVLADLPLHQQVFGGCGPRYEVERGKVSVLYSAEAEEGELNADKIIDHINQTYNSLEHMVLTSGLKKRDISFRYTALDVNDGSSSDVAVQRAIRSLGDIWGEHSEKTLWRLQHAAPKALAELFAALNILKEPNLSSENVAQIATSFRRTLEEITRQFCPPANGEKPGWVKNQWKLYAEQNREKLGAYADVIESEAVGIDNSVGRLGTLYGMGNKGVHENWDAEIFRSVALRLILLVHDLMMVGPKRRVVQLEQSFILSILDNEL